MYQKKCLCIVFIACIKIAIASFCGDAAVPFSFEALSSGYPVLGCARTNCLGWLSNGELEQESARFSRSDNRVDGYMRRDTLSSYQKISTCVTEFEEISCSSKNHWVGGIAPINNLTEERIKLRCCAYDPAFPSTDRGIAFVNPGQIVIGGEVVDSDTEHNYFDFIANVEKIDDKKKGTVSYRVAIRRMRCTKKDNSLGKPLNKEGLSEDVDDPKIKKQKKQTRFEVVAIDLNERFEKSSRKLPNEAPFEIDRLEIMELEGDNSDNIINVEEPITEYRTQIEPPEYVNSMINTSHSVSKERSTKHAFPIRAMAPDQVSRDASQPLDIPSDATFNQPPNGFDENPSEFEAIGDPIGEAPVAKVPAFPIGEAPVAKVPALPIGEAPVAKVPALPIAESPVAKVPALPIGEAPVAKVPALPIAESPVAKVPELPPVEKDEHEALNEIDDQINNEMVSVAQRNLDIAQEQGQQYMANGELNTAQQMQTSLATESANSQPTNQEDTSFLNSFNPFFELAQGTNNLTNVQMDATQGVASPDGFPGIAPSGYSHPSPSVDNYVGSDPNNNVYVGEPAVAYPSPGGYVSSNGGGNNYPTRGGLVGGCSGRQCRSGTGCTGSGCGSANLCNGNNCGCGYRGGNCCSRGCGRICCAGRTRGRSYYYYAGAPSGGGGGGGAFYCFSADTKVRTIEGTEKKMMDLKTGDWVQSLGESGAVEYTPVTSWLHRVPHQKAAFINILLEDFSTLKITPEHYIYVANCDSSNIIPDKPVYAGDISRGDCLIRVTKSGTVQKSKVLQLKRIGGRGVYAPLTSSGTIIVNGVHASCYSVVRPKELLANGIQYLKDLLSFWNADDASIVQNPPNGFKFFLELIELVIPTSISF